MQSNFSTLAEDSAVLPRFPSPVHSLGRDAWHSKPAKSYPTADRTVYLAEERELGVQVVVGVLVRVQPANLVQNLQSQDNA